MKRKFFTLLFALVALASFQVQAIGPLWIKADTTGLGGTNPYGGNKTSPLTNWLVWTAAEKAGINTSDQNILVNGDSSQFNVTTVGVSNTVINITSTKDNKSIKLTYGGNDWSQFEIVQFTYPAGQTAPFWGGIRQTQPLANGVAGYLMPAQGGTNLKDTTSNMLMVLADKYQQMIIKPVDSVFKITTADNPVFNAYNYVMTSYPTFNYQLGAGATQADKFKAGMEGLIAVLNPAMAANGFTPAQKPLEFGTEGGYDRTVAYVSSNYVGLGSTDPTTYNFSDPSLITQYTGTETSTAAVLADITNWTNGLPKDYTLSQPTTDGYGDNASGSGMTFAVVIQLQAATVGSTAQKVTVQTGLDYTARAIANQWRPVWISLETPKGRWATATDFPNSKFLQLMSGNSAMELGGYTTFSVKQVDYVGTGGNSNVPSGLFTTTNGLSPEGVIPLFVFSCPDAGGKVLSVSRSNELTASTLQEGAYANPLEVRNYGTYYDKNGLQTLTCGTAEDKMKFNKYVALQKFAVWIDENGKMTLYPAASYHWKYGYNKNDQDQVQPNTALAYNKIDYNDPNADAVKIGVWKDNSDQITTVPVNLQGLLAYGAKIFTCIEKPFTGGDFATGKYYYLVVNTDKTGLTSSYDTKVLTYVLSTQVTGTTKQLIVVPQDTLRTKDAEYWLAPHDSVNMAAQWEIIKKDNLYTFVNMLGDTLKFNPGATQATLLGGYLPVNGLIPGNPNGGGYFNLGSANWFGPNADAPGCKTWKLVYGGGQDGFFYFEMAEGNSVTMELGNWHKTAPLFEGIYSWRDIKLSSQPTGLVTAAPCDNISVSLGMAIKALPVNYFGVPADSLSAYASMDAENGYKAIREVDIVGNLLNLNWNEISTNNPAAVNEKVLAACLKEGDAPEIKFIPVSEGDGVTRTTSIKALLAAAAAAGAAVSDPLATLYDETYKWYLVQVGGKYLSFSWVNRASGIPDNEKVGLVFTDILENAIPVRFYQPLVGDKKDGNFVLQFYMPKYNYKRTADGDKNKVIANNFPNTLDITKVCFATLGKQSNYLFATPAYAPNSGTRFVSDAKEPDQPEPCPLCPGQFISPSWMVKARLLNLPLSNQIFDGGSVVPDISFGNDQSQTYGVITKDAKTTLKHTYAGKIENGVLQFLKADGTWSTTKLDKYVHGGTTVWLYTIQNSAGQFLTVDSTCMLKQTDEVTRPDVNGIRLKWKAPTNNLNDTILRLFAISGCEKGEVTGNYAKEFFYLPAASYSWDYMNGKIVLNPAENNGKIFYNYYLGTVIRDGECEAIDVRDCYRISQYSTVGNDTKWLGVFNSSSNPTLGGNYPPVQFKPVKPVVAELPDCNVLVMLDGKNRYFTVNDTLPVNVVPDSNRIAAHWYILKLTNDTVKFVSEVPKAADGGINQTQLGDNYLIFDKDKANGKYTVLDVSKYGPNQFAATQFDIVLTCIDKHTVPYWDLEKDGHLNLLSQLAILETPFLDRNITYRQIDDKGKQEVTKNGSKYQTYINKTGDNFANADYLNVYPEDWEVLVTIGNDEKHVIPYYSFSVTIPNDGEYFLNVSDKDSVFWTKLGDTDKSYLVTPDAWKNRPARLDGYVFCLPYKVDANGKKETVVYSDNVTYPCVYIQSYGSDPSLLVSGMATKYVTATKLMTALQGVNKSANPYLVDYTKIDQKQVTSWIFGSKLPSGNIWVPIWDAIAGGSKEGITLTNFLLNGGGASFIAESGHTDPTPNYGILTGLGDAPKLTVEYQGDTVMGSRTLPLRRIWYYRINLDGKYLTDATGMDDEAYFYKFGDGTQVKYAYGWFNPTRLPDDRGYLADVPKIHADTKFVQTFGFRYLDDNDQDYNQRFFVVSNASYKAPNPDLFRYLAEVNNQLVFVTNKANALVFQWGAIKDGQYTDIQVVGQAGIYGVQGGVKFLSTTGKADIYTIDGRLIKSVVLTGSEQVVPAPRGVAVVKTGSKVVKVVVQ